MPTTVPDCEAIAGLSDTLPAATKPAGHAVTLELEGPQARATAETLAECLGEAETAVSLTQQGPQRWRLDLYAAEPPDMAALSALVAEIAGPQAAASLSAHPLVERDWVAASLAGLAPVRAGRFVVHGSHDRAQVRPPAIGIEIEAALAFGTGHHGTTRGCLIALDALLRRSRPRRILDLGTGTGVLAIAAARALHRPVTAGDIDLVSVRVARANARANRAGTLVRAARAAGLTAPALRQAGPYDLVLANILLLPLQRLAAPIARATRQGATVVLSGLLPPQGAAAIASYRAAGFALERRLLVEGWVTLVMRRHGRRTLAAGASRPRPA